VRYRGVSEVQLDMYDPAAQTPLAATDLVIRTASDPTALAGVIQAEARAAGPDVVVTGITSMDAVVGRAMAPWRFASWVLALFAGLALLLAIVGLVSVISLDVAHRQREFAIRLALGARSGEVMARVLRGTLARVTLGSLLGLAVAGLLGRALDALLFGVPPVHWPTYAIVLVVVLLVALIAAWAPVRWASRTIRLPSCGDSGPRRTEGYEGVRSISSRARIPDRMPNQNVLRLTSAAVVKQEYISTAREVRIGSTRSCCAR